MIQKIGSTILLALLVFPAQAWPGVGVQNTLSLDIFLDLHYTLLYPLVSTKASTGIVIHDDFQNQNQRVSDLEPEFLQALSRLPGARISFFSSTSLDEAKDVLSQIPVDRSKSAFELAEGRVYGYSEMTPVKSSGAVGTDRLSAVMKKNLAGKATDLSRAILVDDQRHFALQDQEHNMLWLQETYEYVEDFDSLDGGALKNTKFMPATWRQWFLERNKLARALGLIEEALKVSDKTGQSPVEALWALQHDEQGNLLSSFSQEQIKFYEAGWNLMKVDVPQLTRCRLALEF